MQCSICNAELPADSQVALCPECSKKLSAAAAGSVGMGFAGQTPRETTGAAKPKPSGPTGDLRWKTTGNEQYRIASPMSAAVTPQGEVLLLDQPDGFRVLQFDERGTCLGVRLEVPLGDEDGCVDDPKGLCVSPQGTLCIPDAGNDRICLWAETGKFLRVLGESGDGPGEFAHPADVDVDADGYVYVADSFNRRIQKLSADGLLSLEIKSLGDFGRFENPVAVTVDTEGNIYACDEDRNLLVKFAPDGKVLFVLPKTAGDADLFDGASDVRVDRAGMIYVADRRNLRIRRFKADGTLDALVDLSSENAEPLDGGDIALLNGCVLIPDGVNDRLVCMAFGPLGE
jgi:DNA-binding beta-propeller fold protein YncE